MASQDRYSRYQTERYEPACRLVSLFSASGSPEDLRKIAVKLGRKAASYGETVLVLDGGDGALLKEAGIIAARTLADIATGTAQLHDALYVTSNEHFTATSVGDQTLEDALGLLATLSLSYDWVIVVPEAGCTTTHIRLAMASDVSLISYDTDSDGFMRAYWMMDAIRSRMPDFDSLVLSTGEKCDAVETALMLNDTVRDHLGAPPTYAGHADDLHIEARLLTKFRALATKFAVA